VPDRTATAAVRPDSLSLPAEGDRGDDLCPDTENPSSHSIRLTSVRTRTGEMKAAMG
jgi:hypothetical protein